MSDSEDFEFSDSEEIFDSESDDAFMDEDTPVSDVSVSVFFFCFSKIGAQIRYEHKLLVFNDESLLFNNFYKLFIVFELVSIVLLAIGEWFNGIDRLLSFLRA
jgi:hypothetical protein